MAKEQLKKPGDVRTNNFSKASFSPSLFSTISLK
jgi:hypothetical protein